MSNVFTYKSVGNISGGGTLPLQCPPTHTNKKKEVVTPSKKNKTLNPRYNK